MSPCCGAPGKTSLCLLWKQGKHPRTKGGSLLAKRRKVPKHNEEAGFGGVGGGDWRCGGQGGRRWGYALVTLYRRGDVWPGGVWVRYGWEWRGEREEKEASPEGSEGRKASRNGRPRKLWAAEKGEAYAPEAVQLPCLNAGRKLECACARRGHRAQPLQLEMRARPAPQAASRHR